MKYKIYSQPLLIFCLGLIWSSQTLFAQNLEADFLKINALYQAQNYQAQMEMRWYASHTAMEPLEVSKGEMRVRGKEYFSRMGDIETLHNQQYTVMAHHGEHLLMIQPAVTIPERPTVPDLDTALTYCEEVVFSEYDAQHNSYLFYFKKGVTGYEKFMLVFDKTTFQLHKMVFFLPPGAAAMEGMGDEGARYEVIYSAIKINPSFPANAFSERLYLQLASGKFKPLPAYKSYQFSNYLPIN